MALRTFEIEPTRAQRGSVIWMHGLGATPHDFDDVVPELEAPHLRFIFPAAPVRAVTINQGYRMPAWYDILTWDRPPNREDEAGVRGSAIEIEALIEREHARGVPHDKIVLAGFSQGAAMALHVGARARRPLGGLLVLSGYMVLPDRFQNEHEAAARVTPALVCHGRYDPVVPVEGGRQAYAALKDAGHPAEWAEYDIQHTMCLEEVYLIKQWLRSCYPELPPAP